MAHIEPSVKWRNKIRKYGEKKKKKIKKSEKGTKGHFFAQKQAVSECEGGEEREKVEKGFFTSFSDLWKSSRRFSSEREEKLIHASQATHGY